MSLVGRKGKSQKYSEDRISNLPNSIIYHILSFLPTVDAVSTSILSTKWKNHWTNLDTLTFDDHEPSPFYYHSNSKFVSFVDMVLHFHRENPLLKFSLNCSRDLKVYDIRRWIRVSIMKGVRELNLSILYCCFVRFPSCLFKSVTLEVLKLAYEHTIDVPTVVYLPNLKRMDLTQVEFESEVTLPLPKLKVLNLESISFGNIEFVISSFPSLESLVITDPYNLEKLTISSSSLRHLKFEERGHFYSGGDYNRELVLDAPALQNHNLDTCRLRDVQVKDLSSLINSVICLDFSDPYNDRNLYYNTTSILFHGLCNVRSLSLSWRCLCDIIIDHKFPKFPKLTKLRVEVGCYAWPLVQQLIKNSNVLEDLTLVLIEDNCEEANCEHVPSEEDQKIVPECLLSSFRRMNIYGFQGFGDELALIKYLLKNARVMRSMVIEICASLDSDVKINLLQRLLKFRRGSEECKVTVC